MQNRKIFSRSLYEMQRDKAGILTMPDKDSFPIEYVMNKHGYRCEEFNNQKILTLGCSHTEGHGLPIELTWPYLIAKKMNMDYVSLAKGGDGAQGQITKAFQFFKQFYNPEYIFAVFPLARLEIPAIKDFFYSQNKHDKNFVFKEDEITRAMLSNKKLEKFSKQPHIAEDILPEEFAIFYNIIFIRILEQYCKTNNIKFIWTYYQDSSINLMPFQESIDGYFQHDYLNEELKKECHSEFSDNIFFKNAADVKKFPPGHWGFHQHMHIADSIYDML